MSKGHLEDASHFTFSSREPPTLRTTGESCRQSADSTQTPARCPPSVAFSHPPLSRKGAWCTCPKARCFWTSVNLPGVVEQHDRPLSGPHIPHTCPNPMLPCSRLQN